MWHIASYLFDCPNYSDIAPPLGPTGGRIDIILLLESCKSKANYKTSYWLRIPPPRRSKVNSSYSYTENT